VTDNRHGVLFWMPALKMLREVDAHIKTPAYGQNQHQQNHRARDS
jgi:hypothetical protein